MTARMNSRDRAAQCVLSLPLALYHAAHDFPGGVGAIAGAHGVSPATLQNKLNPNLETHVMNIRDMELVAISTQDQRILHSVCAMFNAGFFLYPDIGEADSALFARGADLAREFSELMATVQASVADGRVTEDEVQALDKAFNELMGSGKALIETAKQVGSHGQR